MTRIESVQCRGRRLAVSALAVLAMWVIAGAPGHARAQTRAWEVRDGDVRVHCPLTVGGSFDARTSALKGTLSVDPARTALSGELAIDLKTLDTGISLRNEHMRTEYLEVGKGEGFEQAVVSTIDIGSLASGIKDGEKPFTANLRLHGVSQPVAGRATLTSRGSSVRVEASFPLRISDYGIPAPRYLGVGVRNDLTVRVVFTAANAS